MLARTSFAALITVLALACAAPVALAADARYEGISAEGDVAFFSTTDKLVPGDTDTRRDIYERSFDEGVGGYVTRQVSFGPTGGNNAFDPQYLATDEAGGLVFFSTEERLSGEDKDGATDIYVRDLVANKTTLISAGDASCAGTGCGGANSDVSAVAGGVVADGAVVFFASLEPLSAEDGDEAADVFARDLVAKTTTLVSAGDGSCAGSGCGGGPQPAFFQGAPAVDGDKALFTTTEGLVAGDSDGELDIYLRDLEAGETQIVSTAGTCPGPEVNCTPVFGGAAADGSHVFFETKERIDAADTDSAQDVYEWSGGVATLASRGPGAFNDSFNALYAGRSADGSAVFFATNGRVDEGDDTDNSQDVYVRTGGAATALVSAGDGACLPGCGNGDEQPASLRWVSADGAIALLSTGEALTAADQDSAQDVYRRDLPGGPTTLVSRADPSCSLPGCGNGAQNALFASASAGATHVFFVTAEALVDADADAQTDVYDRNGGATTRVSTGTINGNGPHPAQLQGISQDGGRAFLVTNERLTEEDDFAGEEDVYSRAAGVTLLVSASNNPELELGPPPPELERTDPVSPNPSTEPRIIGSEVEAAAAIKLYTTADCSGEPVATGSAEELAEPGIAVSVASGSTTSFRGTAEAEGFTSGCSTVPLTYTQEGSEPPPPPPGDGPGGSDPAGGGAPASAPVPGPAPPKTRDDGIPYVTPATRITFGPAFKTRVRRPVFRFTDSTGQPDTRFFCRLDRQRWKPCGSPTRLRRLDRGRHVFSVKARNGAGTWEQRPARRKFKLVASR